MRIALALLLMNLAGNVAAFHWHATCGTMSEFTPDRRPRPWSAWRYTKFVLTISAVYITLVVLQMAATILAMRQ